jgi:hypothetical protein
MIKEKKYNMTSNNQLIHEKSPYLIQHARNPVYWYPWCENAFQQAKSKNKPVFLSIGYATCHWCHVMEDESFKDTQVARLLNDAFICVKVDREERPDIDSLYMKASQMMSGATGWPLTVIMTPDKKPFFSATYIPKTSRFGRIGLVDLIPKIKNQWQTHASQMIEYADHITQVLAKPKSLNQHAQIHSNITDMAISNLSQTYDKQFGGFGNAPKFPSSHTLSFLLQSNFYQKSAETLLMVEFTLQQMRLGGIYDHVGYGFHRYSTDSKWLIPHFEKMLYDQAVLSYTYLEAFQVTGNPFYSNVAEEIFTYVLRDMTSPDGAFYSAEDADSEGEEGKYYVWTINELKALLSEKEYNIISEWYPVHHNGNFSDEQFQQSNGSNILYLKSIMSETQKQIITPVLEKLFNARLKRTPPLKDTKILTDWNAMMIASFAKGASVLHSNQYKDVAMLAMDFLCTKMLTDNDRLMHRYKDGHIAIMGKLDDYAYMIHALLEVYANTLHPQYLETALGLTTFVLEHFWDSQNHGFFLTSDEDEKLIVRPKDTYDAAIPSGNAVMAGNLMKLSRITGQMTYEEKAYESMMAVSKMINRVPQAFTRMIMAYQFAQNDSYEIVICGKKQSTDSKELLKKMQSVYRPDCIVLFKPDEYSHQLSNLAPYTKNQHMIDQKTSVYICKGHSCQAPVTDMSHLDRYF